MINKDIKNITFADLLELQKQLDEEVAKPRDNGFVPRERTLLDIKLALDDEFQEWLRELPKEYNFKTWKQKEYNRENELTEMVDVLFFFLAYINSSNGVGDYALGWLTRNFNKIGKGCKMDFKSLVFNFKKNLFSNYIKSFEFYIQLINLRGFTKEEIIQTYINKWKKNMQRIKGDWSNEV